MSDHYAYLDHLQAASDAGIALIRCKTETYGDSWRARGGRGAWYTLVRPMDRLQQMVEHDHQGDIFAAISSAPDGGDGTVLDAVRDLRNYLLLVEAEMVSRNHDLVNKHPEFVARLDGNGYSYNHLTSADEVTQDGPTLQERELARQAGYSIHYNSPGVWEVRLHGHRVHGTTTEAGAWTIAAASRPVADVEGHTETTAASPTPTPPSVWTGSQGDIHDLKMGLNRLLDRLGLSAQDILWEHRHDSFHPSIVLRDVSTVPSAPRS